MSSIVEAMFEAKNYIASKVSPIPGVDLIEVLADAIVNDGALDMTVDEVKDLVVTVARQRHESMM